MCSSEFISFPFIPNCYRLRSKLLNVPNGVKNVLNFQDIPNICLYGFWPIYPLICSLVLAFALKVLGQVNTDVFNFSSIHLANNHSRKPQEMNAKPIH